MHVHNLYADADGESHFRDMEIELSDSMFGIGLLSKPAVRKFSVLADTTWRGGPYDA